MKRIISIIILCLCVLSKIQAQTITVQSFKMDEKDLTANTEGTIVKDRNGHKCALIKVLTIEKDLSFDVGSLGIAKTLQKNGEIWVYVPEGVKRITISHPQFGVLNNYDLGQRVRRARTYILELKTKVSLENKSDEDQNVAWFVCGTRRELKEQGILENGKILEGDFNQDYFTKLNINIDKEIKTFSNSAEILSNHPNESYQLFRDKHKQYILKIINPKLFWDITKYLVIQTRNFDSADNKNTGSYIEKKEIRMISVDTLNICMVKVYGGNFNIGATFEQKGDAYEDENPVHAIWLPSFFIGETEVTQDLWEVVMGKNPSIFKGNKRPVENVSWKDCQKFIEILNKKTGLKFRLPTEAEWEFAARGGKITKNYKYSGSNNIDSVACYRNNTNSTHDVKTKRQNEQWLYDMSGNVCEWCQDFYGDYVNEKQINPTGPISGSTRIIRGGGWNTTPTECRVSHRKHKKSNYRNSNLGLRLALSLN